MDYQRINKLLDKYWECATSVEEERELRQFFSSAVVPPDLLPYKAWFVSHEAEALPPLGKEFDARILEHISEDRKLITTFGTLFKSITHLIHKIMGTNMKKAFTTLLCLLFCITISAQDKAADLSKLVGDWSFSAPDAPYGYQDGSFQIKQENGKLTAKVNIQGSQPQEYFLINLLYGLIQEFDENLGNPRKAHHRPHQKEQLLTFVL
jgi:hypothetical protein